jgi:hypothetical protein
VIYDFTEYKCSVKTRMCPLSVYLVHAFIHIRTLSNCKCEWEPMVIALETAGHGDMKWGSTFNADLRSIRFIVRRCEEDRTSTLQRVSAGSVRPGVGGHLRPRSHESTSADTLNPCRLSVQSEPTTLGQMAM